MAKYLHIMHNGGGASNNYIRFIHKFFDDKEHLFLLSYINDEFKDMPSVMMCDGYNSAEIRKQIKNSKYVFLHSMSLSVLDKVYLLFNRRQLKKIIWMPWGMDLYEPEKKQKTRVRMIIDNAVKKNLRFFVGIFPPDIKYFKSSFGDKAKTFFGPYAGCGTNPLYLTPPEIRKISDKIKNNEPINIVIGHQANNILHHIRVIDWMERFVNENIHIYIPLSYGNHEYMGVVKEYAEKTLGDKVTCMMDFMPLKEYDSFLNNMDIAIFHTERQIGLGNIYPQVYMQKKIYVSGVMYDFFKENSINVCHSGDLDTIEYKEFIKDVDMSRGTEFIRDYLNINNTINLWNNIFAQLQ